MPFVYQPTMLLRSHFISSLFSIRSSAFLDYLPLQPFYPRCWRTVLPLSFSRNEFSPHRWFLVFKNLPWLFRNCSPCIVWSDDASYTNFDVDFIDSIFANNNSRKLLANFVSSLWYPCRWNTRIIVLPILYRRYTCLDELVRRRQSSRCFYCLVICI